jgi:hypothetical protein
MGVVRDPAKNTPWIRLPIEDHVAFHFQGVQASAIYDFPETELARREHESVK